MIVQQGRKEGRDKPRHALGAQQSRQPAVLTYLRNVKVGGGAATAASAISRTADDGVDAPTLSCWAATVTRGFNSIGDWRSTTSQCGR